MMSMAVRPISFTSNDNGAGTSSGSKKEAVQGAATAAGGTAYIAKAAANAQKAEKGLRTVMNTATGGTKVINNFTGKTPKIFQQFKQNKVSIAESFMKWAAKWQNKKFIGPIIKSPLTKAVGKLFGGVLAVFILISGLVRMCAAGAEMLDDTSNKYQQCRV